MPPSGHYREAGGAGRATVEANPSASSRRPPGRLATRSGWAFSVLGETISDDDAKQDLKRAVSAIGDAVTVTVSEAGKAGAEPGRRRRAAAAAGP